MAGNRRPGRDRGQRHQRERAFVQVRVRHAQARLVDHRVAEQQQVEVERARAPARIVFLAVAAELALDIEQRIEQRARIEVGRSEEHTSELQSLMRISYAVFCLKKKKSNIELK